MKHGTALYETARDLVNEERAVTRAAAILRCDGWKKLPSLYQIDFALEKARRIAFWAEVKCRTCPSTEYLDYLLSLAKFEALLHAQAATGIPATLIVGWTDCLGILTFPCPATYCDVGGRRDRGGANDIEPLVHFPVESFRRHPWESRQ